MKSLLLNDWVINRLISLSASAAGTAVGFVAGVASGLNKDHWEDLENVTYS